MWFVQNHCKDLRTGYDHLLRSTQTTQAIIALNQYHSEGVTGQSSRAGPFWGGPIRTQFRGTISTQGSRSRTPLSSHSTAACATNCWTRRYLTPWTTPAGSWRSGVTITTPSGRTHRSGTKHRPKRAGRLSNLRAPRPARLPSPKPTTAKIKPADARHERGTSGGQVNHQIVPVRKGCSVLCLIFEKWMFLFHDLVVN